MLCFRASNSVGYSRRPRAQPVKFSLIINRCFGGCDELGERADIDANAISAGRHGFHQRRPAPNVIVDHQVARTCERFNRGAGKKRAKAGRVL